MLSRRGLYSGLWNSAQAFSRAPRVVDPIQYTLSARWRASRSELEAQVYRRRLGLLADEGIRWSSAKSYDSSPSPRTTPHRADPVSEVHVLTAESSLLSQLAER